MFVAAYVASLASSRNEEQAVEVSVAYSGAFKDFTSHTPWHFPRTANRL